jgi:SNF family Na+-dependent transporter
LTVVVNNANSAAHWASHFVFLLAQAGFAVGLKNVWGFAYVTGENASGVEGMKTRKKLFGL